MFVKRRLILYRKRPIIYTKHYIDKGLRLRRISKQKIEKNLRNPFRLRYAEKQIKTYKGFPDERYLSHFVYSNKMWLSTPLKFNHGIKVLTAYESGRDTIRKLKMKFKW